MCAAEGVVGRGVGGGGGGSLLWGVLYTDDSRGCRRGGRFAEGVHGGEEGGLRISAHTHTQTHTLTLEVAFPFKSPIPLRYAELMQDLLRQWGNTAELCSLCCQQACKEEEGEQACTGGGRGGGERKREREGEREQTMSFCSGGNAAVKFAAPWKHITSNQEAQSECREVFLLSFLCERCGQRLVRRYAFLSSLVLFNLFAFFYDGLFFL